MTSLEMNQLGAPGLRKKEGKGSKACTRESPGPHSHSIFIIVYLYNSSPII